MRRAFPTILGAVISLAACTGGGYDAGDVREDTAHTASAPRVSAVLFVERSVGGVTSDVQVGARFQRVVGLSDESLTDLVGTPSMPRLDACVTQNSRAAEAASEGGRAEVRLLDVGGIDVRTAGPDALRLSPRRFPDLWNVVSGVLYGAEGPLQLGRWRFTVDGSPVGESAADAGIGRFEVEGESPDELGSVRLGEAVLPALPGSSMALHRGPLAVRWTRGKSEDRVSVVFDGDGTIVCGAHDDGAFDVDAATMDRVAEVLRNGGTVSVHRLRARAFTAVGIDSGALMFDLSVRARARVE